MAATAGRALIDEQGRIVEADAGFAAIVGAAGRSVIGRALIDFAAPSERDAALLSLQRARDQGLEARSLKRLVGADGVFRWVTSHLAPVPGSQPPRFTLDLVESAPPTDWVAPGDLLRIARVLLDARLEGRRAFGHLIFADHAWDILLAAYIREAEGSLLPVGAVPALVGGRAANVRRWLLALRDERLVEMEDGPESATIRLSCHAHRQFEGFLSRSVRMAGNVPGDTVDS